MGLSSFEVKKMLIMVFRFGDDGNLDEFVCFYDWAECRVVRRIDVNVKNIYWSDSGDLVAIASDSSFYVLKYNRDIVSSYLDSGKPVDEQVGDCFIYNNSAWRLNYVVGGEVTTMFHLDRPMYLLGYLASQSHVYLIDKEFNVMSYTLLLSLIEYKTLVLRGDLEMAEEILPTIPKEHLNSVAQFLESRGMLEDALEVATDADYRFDLSVQLGRLDVAKVSQSESKWKQLGELAMSARQIDVTKECLAHASDLSGLLLLYSALGDVKGLEELSATAKEQGKNNVAFLCLFLLQKMEAYIQLLVESNRIPEAAFFARTYLPSEVSRVVGLWRNDLKKVKLRSTA
ncbi:unnamed protein product [Calypogeia fissa]